MSLRTVATTALATAAGALLAVGAASSAQAAPTAPQTSGVPAASGDALALMEDAVAPRSLTTFLLGSGN
ncbi:hypothetical protein [Streptomyces roseolilacinus]|uniref:Uncharacterized protein n=1 Tax=Streptomyces roseolilacinus TaxID=66904 RepID=A0A918B294_9ACTN|nr:hypothetical protein [Streptomyces roseolilacinus]GGQ08866.1 hypothetical protein GCM10010249_29150 [Streptomyces roseolilacinus]